jgi:hypothetical protein
MRVAFEEAPCQASLLEWRDTKQFPQRKFLTAARCYVSVRLAKDPECIQGLAVETLQLNPIWRR